MERCIIWTEAHGSIKQLDLPCCCSSRIFRMAARIIFLSSYSLAARSLTETEKLVSTGPVSSVNMFHVFFSPLIPFWWAHQHPVPTAVFLPGCPTSLQILTWKRQWSGRNGVINHGTHHVLEYKLFFILTPVMFLYRPLLYATKKNNESDELDLIISTQQNRLGTSWGPSVTVTHTKKTIPR